MHAGIDAFWVVIYGALAYTAGAAMLATALIIIVAGLITGLWNRRTTPASHDHDNYGEAA